MAGDGGFMVNVGEWPLRPGKLPFIVVLFDDAGYGVLRIFKVRPMVVKLLLI